MISIRETLSELRLAVEGKKAYKSAQKDAIIDGIKEIVAKNTADAMKPDSKLEPDLINNWVDMAKELGVNIPRAKDPDSAEMTQAQNALAAMGYHVYLEGGNTFVYEPGGSPAHIRIARLKEMRKKINADKKSFSDPAEVKMALKEIDKKIKDEKESKMYTASETAAAKAKTDDADPDEPQYDAKAVSSHSKAVKAAKAAEAAAEAEADPAKKAELQKQAADLWIEADKLEPKALPKPDDKKGRSFEKSPAAKRATEPDDETEPTTPYWNKLKVGGFQQTKTALNAVDQFDGAMNGVLDILAKDPEQKASTGDRKTRLANLVRSLQNTVMNADIQLKQVGVPQDKKKGAAEEVENA